MRKLIFLLSLFIVFNSCSRQNKDGKELSRLIDSIGGEFAPDRRLAIWDIRVERDGNNLIVAGSTNLADGYEELKVKLPDKFRNIENKVKLLPSAILGDKTWGVTTLSAGNIRREPKHSSELVSQALLGTPVKVFDKQDGWYRVQTPDRYIGWIDPAGVALFSETGLKAWKLYKKVLYNNQSGYAYKNADAKSQVCSDLVLADLLAISDSTGDFYQTVFPDGREAFVKKSECIGIGGWAKPEGVDTKEVVWSAKQFLGIPYLWGGVSSKMADCSGLTKTSYYKHGVILQRDASQQALYGGLVDTKNGYRHLQAGDLLFFGRTATDSLPGQVTHVGIYIGDSEFIHSSGKVRINSFDPSREDFVKYYVDALVLARRVKGHIGEPGIEWVVENEFYEKILP
ncbi:hypothetical protein MNBD_BACTEROID01-2930 [hydrothermal vent metagenome]|uniref:Uncharacterized protein n=1 Tax=hydrothermal vent metagenome TaxID=652676 RepID=A0A3B0U3L4_9ZZZZ